MQTHLSVADNSGARRVMCVKVLGGARRRFAYESDVIVVSIKEAIPSGKVKKGDVCRALIVRTKYPSFRGDGASIRFDDNAVVLINKQNEPIGSRVFGPVSRGVRNKKGRAFLKLISLAPEVV